MAGVLDKAQIVQSLTARRRELAALSPQHFAQVYLSHHFSLPPSRMHVEIFDLLADASASRSQRIAVAAPRGNAKSTVVSLAYVLWSVLCSDEPFVVIVSATREQAVQLLKTVKDELQTNPLLLADMPDVCRPPGARGKPKPWRDNNILLANGVMLRALGANQAMRGLKHGAHRPTLIVVDDLENQEQCDSADQRAKLKDWFERTLLKAGDHRTNVIVVGTIVHYDSLLANLTGVARNPIPGSRWASSAVYRAVESWSDHADLWTDWERIYIGDESHNDVAGPHGADAFFEDHESQMLDGTSVLWPERESYQQLMLLRLTEGRRSFDAEKQNEPLDSEQCLFDPNQFRFWDDPANPEFRDIADLLNKLGSRVRIFGACDPSLGRATGDYTAIMTVAHDRDCDVMYVLDADVARRKPAQVIDAIVTKAQFFKYCRFVVESNQFQEMLADDLERRLDAIGHSASVRRISHSSHKQARIQNLEPFITQGRLRFSTRHQLLLDQLRQFPLGAHDDGPDALEMVVDLTRNYRGGVTVSKLTGY